MKAALRLVTLTACVTTTYSCTDSNLDYDVLVSHNVQCPSASHLEYLPWGKSGLRAVCIAENGPVVIAEGGRVVIEGQYAKGTKVGEWRWFDAMGKVVRTEHYETSNFNLNNPNDMAKERR